MAPAQPSRKSRRIGFLEEPVPDYGAAHEVAPGVRRIVAANASVMTYHGTNTFLIEGEGGTVVLDPGPDRPEHVDAIMRAAGGRILAILVSHGHQDHIGAARPLAEASGAPVHSPALPPATNHLAPDVPLTGGGRIGALRALATPGHTRDHFCFAREEDGLLFTADHVMSWSSSVVTPRWGDMGDYLRSLDLLIRREDAVMLPGHGPAMPEPRPFFEALRELKLRRESALLDVMADGPVMLEDMVRRIYPHLSHPKSVWAAGQNMVAHLHKLRTEGTAVELDADRWTLKRP